MSARNSASGGISRKRFLGIGTMSTTALMLGAGTVSARAQGSARESQVATGVVFEDLNKSGRRDSSDPGVANVAISNGREVVRTDEDGRYSIGVTEETILFMTKPSGYMVPVDENQLTRFYYVHYPSGSPVDTFYPGIEPTGPLPESIDFPLYRQEEPDSFEVLLFADPQTTNRGELADFRADLVRELIGTDAAFGLTAGDVVNDPLDLFEPHNRIVANIGLPWWNLPGNHDINFDVPGDTYSTQTFKSVYGPTDYSFEYGRAHFVCMDNVQYFGKGGGYRGFLNERQLEWLANDLASVPGDKLIVIATHIPLRTEAIGADNINTANLDELLEVLEGREHLFSFSGHDTSNSWQIYLEPGETRQPPQGVNPAVWNGEKPFHHQVLAEVRGGGWTTGPVDARGVHAADAADGNPNGYYFLSVAGNGYSTRFKPASLPADFQMRITFRGGEGNRTLASGERVWVPSGPSGSQGISPVPRFHPRDWSGEHGPEPLVEANVFDGGERHRVEARFDDRGFAPMSYNPPRFGLTDGEPDGNLDTYMQVLFEQYAGTAKEPAEPQPSSHIWRVPVPRNLGPGEHTVTIRSTDPYGRVAESSQRFEVVTGRPPGSSGR